MHKQIKKHCETKLQKTSELQNFINPERMISVLSSLKQLRNQCKELGTNSISKNDLPTLGKFLVDLNRFQRGIKTVRA